VEFEDVVHLRNSVRKFSNREVEKEKIEAVLECARLAPSWANKQCWSFVVVTRREKIASLYKPGTMINRWMRDVPVMLVACGDPELSGNHHDIEYFPVDVAIAMEHLVLSAVNLGLGTCWMGVFDEDRIKKILDIPEKIKIVALSPLGYPAEKKGVAEGLTKLIVQSKKRKPLDEISHYEQW